MQSLNMKQSTTSETSAQPIATSNPTRDSTNSLTETLATSAEVDKPDKSDKAPQKSKAKEVKGKPRAGVRIRDESGDQNASDSVRPFLKQNYPPLTPLPSPKEIIPATTLPPP